MQKISYIQIEKDFPEIKEKKQIIKIQDYINNLLDDYSFRMDWFEILNTELEKDEPFFVLQEQVEAEYVFRNNQLLEDLKKEIISKLDSFCLN